MAGPKFGKGSGAEFLVNSTESGRGEDAQLRVEGVYRSTFTAAQIDSANGTPLEVLPAPGTLFFNIVNRVVVSKAAGTAFGGIAAGEDLTFLYAGGSVQAVADVETTGFLDATTDEIRIVRAIAAASGTGSIDATDILATAVEMSLLVGDITLGSEVIVDVYYERFPSVLVND